MCSCNKIHKSTAVVGNGTNLIIYVDADSNVPQVRQKFNFKICQQIPCDAGSLPAQISVNGTAYALLNKFGEPAVGSDLRCGGLYCGYYAGLTDKHFITFNAPVICCGCNESC